MIKVSNRPVFVPIVLLALFLGGCALAPVSEETLDPRLDKLVTGMDQSLANQGAVNEQLQQQQKQLELQQQRLESLTKDVSRALENPVAEDCPPAVACLAVTDLSDKQVVGEFEQVWFSDLAIALSARMDTGAQTASLDARNIERFERDGKKWVRFEILHPESGEPVLVERRLKGTVGLIQAGSSETVRRPVVKLGITIGHVTQTAEFILTDRTHKGYQVLIGRNILQDVMVVDVSEKNVAPYLVPHDSANDSGTAR